MTSDPGIYDYLPELRHHQGGDHAGRRLPVLLRVHQLWRASAAEAGRLLRVLLIRFGDVSAHPGAHFTDAEFCVIKENHVLPDDLYTNG
jgi:hypothetical protein